ncbi:MAG: phage head-tail connector protein [Paraclostridium sp.]
MATHKLTCDWSTDYQPVHDPLCTGLEADCPLLGGDGIIEVDAPLDTTHQHDDRYPKKDHNHDGKYAPPRHSHFYNEIGGLYTHHHKNDHYTRKEMKTLLENLGVSFVHKFGCYKPAGTLNYENQWVHDDYCNGKTDPNCPLFGGKGEVVVDINPNVYTKAEIDAMLSGFEPGGGGGTVDLSNYYTKQQVDTKFVDKNTLQTNYYDKTEVNNKVESSYTNINTVLRDRVKALLNVTGTTFDKFIDECMAISSGLISRYLGVDTVPTELEFVLIECTIVRYNRIGSEGLTSEGIDGYSSSFIEDILSPYHQYLDDYIGRNADKCNSFKVLRTL